MTFDHFPFIAVTMSALFAHIVAGLIAGLLQPVWKGDTFLDLWWEPAFYVRLFGVERSQVKLPITWICIVTSRIALIIFVISLLLDIFIN